MPHEEIEARLAKAKSVYLASKSSPLQLKRLGRQLVIPIEEEISQTPEIQCHKGCSHCCYLRVVAFSHEIVAIYFYLVEKLSTADLEETKRKVNEQFRRIEGMTRDEHFAKNIKCPLLKDDKCSVYSARPISCAGYHSMSEAKCRESNEHPEVIGNEDGGIPMVVRVKEVQNVQNSIAYTILESQKDDSAQYELIASLKRLFDDPRLIREWKKGKQIFTASA